MRKMKKLLVVLFCLIVGFQMQTDVSAAELSGKWDFLKIVIPSFYDDVYMLNSAEFIRNLEPYWEGVYIEFENDTDYSMQTSTNLVHNTYQKMDESTMKGCDMYNLGGFNEGGDPIPMYIWRYENQMVMKFNSVFTLPYPDNTSQNINVDTYFVFENEELEGSASEVFTADNIASLEADSSVDIPDTFTNKYGTPTTKCAHPGCENYIASSGATDCCPDHSNTCDFCGKYIIEHLYACNDCTMDRVEQLQDESKEQLEDEVTGEDTFTNKYGTPTTKCAHSGCENYIASSGDTNCCTVHSHRCLNCNKYIDEDAAYCMDCLTDSAEDVISGTFTNKYGTPTTKCAHSGCENYIASSGDTNCCTTHSHRCLNCNKYIDEDAVYCMDCLSDTISSKAADSYPASSSTESQHSPGTCQYKEGGKYVCDRPATKGDLCQEHFDYLDNIYNSLIGN